MERKWPPSARWTEDDVAQVGFRNKERMDFSVARAMNFLMDRDKEKRLKSNLCALCFYSGPGMAGQAITGWNCRVCLKDQPLWGNTSPPLACEKCSKKHKLCTDCGADLYLRVRRSNVVPITPRALRKSSPSS